jgi:hypothetical protein
MTERTTERPRRLASPDSSRASQPARRVASLLIRLGCVALLAWIGYIHLHLWQEGYRQIPTDGPLFLLDSITGFVLAAVLLVRARPITAMAAAGYAASTLGALLLSLSVGLFGFHESISAAYVSQSLIIETITVVALLAWAAEAATRRPRAQAAGAGPGHAG